MKDKSYKIFLTGGGTGGPVTPLLAVVDEFKIKTKPGEFNFLWVGTRQGIEIEMVKKAGVAFKAISSGKFRRYFSWRNIIDPIFIFVGFVESIVLITRFRPDLIMSAGGFVSVPVVWAGWLLRVPILIHQQDVRPGLANKLMSPFAKIITVTFETSLLDYPKKAVWTGNPLRRDFIQTINNSNVQKETPPTLLILGGGTGSAAINDLVWASIEQLLTFCKVIHITGKQKSRDLKNKFQNYTQIEFLSSTEMAAVYTKASLVVSRCGMSVLTELSSLGKPSILIPLPASHQEDNAQIFKQAKGAIILSQNNLIPEVFTDIIKHSILNQDLLVELGVNIKKVIKTDANTAIVKLIKQVLIK
jgi:UDP-N-acetylglucosamine--N-acetylmuramyl-(pentapeptide) pyrophosphoryl-undecaprenol N-acetylglucosamine transferase